MKKDLKKDSELKTKPERYTFTFHDFDHHKVVTVTTTLKTKPISEDDARRLLTEELVRRGKSKTYCYSVMRRGAYVNLLKVKK